MPVNVLEWQDTMLATYEPIGKAEAPELLSAAEEYDGWFTRVGFRTLENKLTISHGKWTSALPEVTQAINETSPVILAGARRIILEALVDWSLRHFPEFYRQGITLYNLQQAMLEQPGTTDRLNRRDAEVVEALVNLEASAWERHIDLHVRQFERTALNNAILGNGSAEFLEAMTAPDLHIVGWPYGNARLSFMEHLRRYAMANGSKAHMMAQIALERYSNAD